MLSKVCTAFCRQEVGKARACMHSLTDIRHSPPGPEQLTCPDRQEYQRTKCPTLSSVGRELELKKACCPSLGPVWIRPQPELLLWDLECSIASLECALPWLTQVMKWKHQGSGGSLGRNRSPGRGPVSPPKSCGLPLGLCWCLMMGMLPGPQHHPLVCRSQLSGCCCPNSPWVLHSAPFRTPDQSTQGEDRKSVV